MVAQCGDAQESRPAARAWLESTLTKLNARGQTSYAKAVPAMGVFVMKPFAFFLCLGICLVSAFSSADAQSSAWEPSSGHTQLPIWPGTAPDAQPAKVPETATVHATSRVAGQPWVYVSNVSQPTMTVYSPDGKNTGAAVVVFPGGGYNILAIDLEGTEVCAWLNKEGITCVLLKYRVPDSGPHHDRKCRCEINPAAPL